MAELQARAWPGNVRELRSVLEVSVVGAGANVLSLEDAFRGTQGMELRANLPLEAVLTSMTWAACKAETKRRYYTGAYSAFRGNVSANREVRGRRSRDGAQRTREDRPPERTRRRRHPSARPLPGRGAGKNKLPPPVGKCSTPTSPKRDSAGLWCSKRD